MITFLFCNASLSTKTFIIDKDAKMNQQLTFAKKAQASTVLSAKRLSHVI